MLKKFLNLVLIFKLKQLSRLPFPVMYVISDMMFFLVYYVFGYRRNVVATNLKKSFPEKSVAALKSIERKYYTHLCDMALETLKSGRMSKEDLQQRMAIRNPELLNRYFEQGRSVTVMAIHYGNWEWLLHMPLHIRHHQFFVYKPLHNPWFDRYLNDIRARFGGETVSMNLALRRIMEADQRKKPVMTWLAADQTPPWFHTFWTLFLNQDTQFFDGPAKIARRFNQPVFIQYTRKIKRGYYETWFELLTDDPQSSSEEEIILSYVQRTEQMIRHDPAWYIWSHRRWKNTRPEDCPLRPDVVKGMR